MIKSNLKSILATVLMVLAGVSFYLLRNEQHDGDVKEDPARRSYRRAAAQRSGTRAKRSRKGTTEKLDEDGRTVVKDEPVERLRERPSFDDLDESEFSELQKAVLHELQRAFDYDDLAGVRNAIARFNAPRSKGGLAGEVPKIMRRKAVTALGWFGSAAATDMLEFMADIDPEVEEEAFAQFELILDDWDVSDRERSDALLALLKAIRDPDRIDSMLMALNNMRNSVKGETIIGILGSGTPEAQAIMREQMEFFTDFDVTDAAGVGEWVKNNPDNEWDEEFYGASKD